MKRKFLISALVIIMLPVFSCKKNEGAQTPDAAPDEIDSPVAVSGEWKDAYVLRVNAAVYILENDTGEETDKTVWNASMALGERVSAGEGRRLTFSGDGAVYDFVKIRRHDGKEGFAWASQIAEAGSLAVVTDERANLYNSPRSVDVTGVILPRKTVAVCYPETEAEGFVEIKAYDPVAQRYRQNYIRLSSVSGRESDVQSSILLQTAEPLGNTGAEKVRKDALLESALLDYPDSAFNADINELMNPTAVVIETEPAHPHYAVNDDNVNVRDLPDPVAGRVIGQLNRDDMVTAIEQTVNPFTVGGQSALWFHITEPMEGWIFGYYLDRVRIE